MYEEKLTEIMNESFSYSASVQSMSAIQSARVSLTGEVSPDPKMNQKLEAFQNEIHELTK